MALALLPSSPAAAAEPPPSDVNRRLVGQFSRGEYISGIFSTTAVDPVAVQAVEGPTQRKHDRCAHVVCLGPPLFCRQGDCGQHTLPRSLPIIRPAAVRSASDHTVICSSGRSFLTCHHNTSDASMVPTGVCFKCQIALIRGLIDPGGCYQREAVSSPKVLLLFV